MLLQEIVDAFDTELSKLYKLRAIIAGLLGNPGRDRVPSSATESVPDQLPVSAVTEAATERKPRARRPRLARVAKERTRAPKRQQPTEHTPLSGPIPRGPVVVMPAALARELAAKTSQRPAKAEFERVPEPGSLGSMIRALHLERLA